MLRFLLKSFRWFLPLAALTSVTAGAAHVLMLSQINAAIAADAGHRSANVWIFIGAAALAMVTGMLSSMLFERLRERANAVLRVQIAARVMTTPCDHIERLGGPRVQAALSEHAANVAQFFVSMPVLLTNSTLVCGGLIYLASLSAPAAVAAAAVIGLGSLGYRRAHTLAIQHLRASSIEQDRLFGHFRTLLSGAKELRLHGRKRASFASGVLGKSIDTVRRERTRGMFLFIAATGWGNFLIYAFIGVMLFGGLGDVARQSQVMTGFALVLVYMIVPLQTLLQAIPNANLASVASERIEALTRQLQSTERAALAADAQSFREVSLQAVTYRYRRGDSEEGFGVGPIDLRLRAGELVFLIGGNGSGKTTLAKLLVGLYRPDGGSVHIDGERVDDDNRDRYRQNFCAIFADFHLFDRLLGAPGSAWDAEANRLIEQLRLQNKVRVSNGRFSTRALSLGQRKRLALAVAMLEKRPFLVCDEWAAEQDPAFKEIFYRQILPQWRAEGRTALVISHDVRYFHIADRLVRMEDGKHSL